MRCAWNELLSILPLWLRNDVDKPYRNTLQELRLRLGLPPELICSDGSSFLSGEVRREDMAYCINTASKYSPWAAESISRGYITCAGGHRIGLCGEAVVHQGRLQTIRSPRSLCIRVARDIYGIADFIPESCGSVLIVGPPGSGKTTLIRDLIRRLSGVQGNAVAVVDERGELFQEGAFQTGPRTDVMSGCAKPDGIVTVLRTMGPTHIAVDEITEDRDCDALIQASYCGVRVLATAHATGSKDLLERPVYRRIVQSGIFDTLITLHPDKSFRTERMMKL